MLTREEFKSLVRKAKENNKNQLAIMMETMGATGVRVSELKFFPCGKYQKRNDQSMEQGKISDSHTSDCTEKETAIIYEEE